MGIDPTHQARLTEIADKRHPSHLVIFSREGDVLKQLNQTWLDGWNYTDQIEFLNEVSQNFQLEKGYIDNTRGELEDRGLHRHWWPMHFSLKTKNTMAHIFEEYVHSGNLKLLRDERQKQQILSVSNELKAPETPLGHGDAFLSEAGSGLATLGIPASAGGSWLRHTRPGSIWGWR